MFTAAKDFSGTHQRFGRRDVNSTFIATNHFFDFAGPLNMRALGSRRIPEGIFTMLEILSNNENTGTPPQFGDNGGNNQNNKQ